VLAIRNRVCVDVIVTELVVVVVVDGDVSDVLIPWR
jgi:hypothetical protein